MGNRNTFPGVDMQDVKSGKRADAVTLAATQTWITAVHQMDNIDIEVTTTGTATAAITIEISSSYRQTQGVTSAPTVIAAGTWTDITLNALTKVPFVTRYGTDPAGAAAFSRFVIERCPSQFIRVKSVLASGAGTITIYMNAKGN